MATSMVVMVLDPDDAKRGEITVVDDPKAAARMVESFLEAGYKQERIRVFNATPLQMQIVQKPVVSFSEGVVTGDFAPQAIEAAPAAVGSNGSAS